MFITNKGFSSHPMTAGAFTKQHFINETVKIRMVNGKNDWYRLGLELKKTHWL